MLHNKSINKCVFKPPTIVQPTSLSFYNGFKWALAFKRLEVYLKIRGAVYKLSSEKKKKKM